MSRDTNKSSTVLKAFRVLEAVAEMPEPGTAPEVAKFAGIERVTTYRMLRTMEEAGYLEMDPAAKTYRVSRRILSLAKPLIEDGPDRRNISELLKAVSKRTGETCHFSELSGIETVLTQRVKGSQLVAVDFRIGTRCELHATSVGKAILAHQSPEFIDDYVMLDLKGYTTKTLTLKEQLLEELETIRQSGISYDFEELSNGMNCVAVPVRSQFGGIEAGISISGPSNRLDRARLAELGQIMREEIANLA
ncbi:IclR family transcriptional regulator [Oricola sp.]|uniref:IclR family transcriptional regulator n=1 Tax=Oricola sp. TaxID=1979950 RepID=UPI003BAC4079